MPSWKVASPRLRSALALALSSVGATLGPRVALAEAGATSSATVATPRVVVAAPDDAPPLLKEALVRAQGELSAVGLTAELKLTQAAAEPVRGSPHLESDVYGLLELEQRGRVITIRAWAPRSSRPIDARVELDAAGVTAEVIAVRAVETLRAAMLEFARSERGSVPEAVRGFTRFTPETKPAAPISTGSPLRPVSAPPLAFWAGPAVSLHAGTSPDLGVQLGMLVGHGVLVGHGAWFGAVAFESTLYDLALSAPHGSAEVRRQAMWGQIGARFQPHRRWEVATRGGIGYASFAIEGDGDSGYHGRSAKHGSSAVMLGVSSTYWATRGFGLYASVGGRLALDAPTIVIAKKSVITLDRPSFVLSLGVSVGVF